MLVDHKEFLQRLSDLFDTTNARGGSIWLTHKRYTYQEGDVQMAGSDAEREYPLLVRAVDGDDVKFSTLAQPSDLEVFHTHYGTLLKAKMTASLRKRDKKREKLRAERAALRKKKLEQDIVIEGPKRGNGRSKRQRRIKAARKLEETRARIRQAEAKKKPAASQ